MPANHHLERVRQSFAEQFEPEGTNFLYRRSMKGAPILVNEAERDRFVADFNRRQCNAMRFIPFGIIALIGLLVFLTRDTDSSGNLGIWSGIGFMMILTLIVTRWSWNAPARALKLRSPTGQARSRDEVRKLMFAKMTYGQLGLAAIGAVFMVLEVSAKNDVLHGWGRLWLVLAGGLIAVAGVQALRKWRHERI